MKMLSNRTGGFLPALIFAVLLMTGLTSIKAQAQYNNGYYDNNGYDEYGDYQVFYDDLAPYGQWLNDPQYGYVWAPSVGRDFRPYYSNGYWVMTDYGNMWVSNYDWGWAPFHYGRWAQSSIYGWIWIPGNVWGPAWVTWRQGGGYYGWAPMGPGISVNISFGMGYYDVPNPWWTFIPCNNIYSRSFHTYYSPRRTVNIINNTTIINNTYVDNRSRNTYVTGPRRSEVERATRQRVQVYNVGNRGRAGNTEVSGRNVNVYRPQITTTQGRSQERIAPRQVKTLDRSAVTNAGGGRAPSRPITPGNSNNNNRLERSINNQQRATAPVQNQDRIQQSRSREMQQQQRVDQRTQQLQQQQRSAREIQQREQQAVQQQRVQREQQQVQRQQMEQQQRIQRDQQMQQQRIQRDQQMQREQQQVQRQQMEQQQRIQRDQQMQQQRIQRDQQMQQQRMQQQQQQREQRSIERAQPQQRMERSAPQRIERSAPQQRGNIERAPRGR